jgi:hypothetical protein
MTKASPFTDEDIKKLKKIYKTDNSWLIPKKMMDAILARLEKAEQVIQSVQKMPEESWDGACYDYAIKAWRKSAGK